MQTFQSLRLKQLAHAHTRTHTDSPLKLGILINIKHVCKTYTHMIMLKENLTEFFRFLCSFNFNDHDCVGYGDDMSFICKNSEIRFFISIFLFFFFCKTENVEFIFLFNDYFVANRINFSARFNMRSTLH